MTLRSIGRTLVALAACLFLTLFLARPARAKVSAIDEELAATLARHGFTGDIESTLEPRLGRKIDKKLVTLGSESHVVVSAAAWVVLDEACRAALVREANVVYLRAHPETLRARIGSGSGRRADATDLSWLEHRFRERDELYQALARYTIDVDERSPDAIADSIVSEVR